MSRTPPPRKSLKSTPLQGGCESVTFKFKHPPELDLSPAECLFSASGRCEFPIGDACAIDQGIYVSGSPQNLRRAKRTIGIHAHVSNSVFMDHAAMRPYSVDWRGAGIAER